LKSQNDALAIENRLKSLFTADTDSLHKTGKSTSNLTILVSKVIHNSYNVHENYLTLNSGALQGVESDTL
jgi:rod shape-determining protein MreC